MLLCNILLCVLGFKNNIDTDVNSLSIIVKILEVNGDEVKEKFKDVSDSILEIGYVNDIL